jgi:predicted permease
MGVLLTAAAIVASTGIGVWSEHRWPRGAAEAARQALLVILYVVLPPVFFLNLAAAHINLDEGVGVLLALLTNIATSVLVWWIASRFLRLPRHQVGAVIVAALVVNTAFLGFPLTIALLGRDQLSTAVLYDVLVSGPLLLLGAFAVGATLAEDAKEATLPIPPPLTRPVVLALVARLVFAPALLTALAPPLIDLPATYRLLIVMPTGLSAMVVSHAYGLDNRTVAETVTWSTARSSSSLP